MNATFIKNKAILMLMYSEGLRVREEVIRLRPGDIDSNMLYSPVLFFKPCENIGRKKNLKNGYFRVWIKRSI